MNVPSPNKFKSPYDSNEFKKTPYGKIMRMKP